MIDFLTLALITSLILNFVLIFFLVKIHKKSKKKTLDATAQQVLAEIMSGPAILKVEVIERDSIIQWKGF